MDFYKRMHLACMRIPRGKVVSYGQIALLCGKPKNSRQVGFGLNRGLAGEVPAHRIVNGNGFLSGAAAFDMPELQKWLLEEEGVEVTGQPGCYRVSLKKFGWKNTMEEARSLAEEFERRKI